MVALQTGAAVVIVNPTAGGGRVGRRWTDWKAAIHATLGDVPIRRTDGPGHATALAGDAVWGGAERIVSIGGDGTHGEVVAGIVKANPPPEQIVFGAVSAGTGGDFQRMLVGPREPFAALAALGRATATPIDVGRVSFRGPDGAMRERVFLNECSIGMSAVVCEGVNASGKPLGGAATYFGHSIDALRRWRSALVRVVVDGQVVGDWSIATVLIANGRYAGGGMCFAPEARLSDGMLDVTVLPHQSGLRMLLNVAPHLYRGTIASTPHAVTFRGMQVAITALRAGDVPAEADGDPIGSLPISATTLPGAIRILGVRNDRL